MNSKKIAEFIKKVRKQEGVSQQKFADKYGVTYQAVSKWENEKNLPDISLLSKICDDYGMNLNDLLKEGNSKFKLKKYIFPCLIVLLLLIFAIFLFIKWDQFEFKTLSSICNNFNLYGSLAYNDKTSSIYISNITYCGEDDETKYETMECTLYEINDKSKNEVSRVTYEKEIGVSLEEFLKDVTFHVDHYERQCKYYQENSLVLEIEAMDENGKMTTYKIPLALDQNC